LPRITIISEDEPPWAAHGPAPIEGEHVDVVRSIRIVRAPLNLQIGAVKVENLSVYTATASPAGYPYLVAR